jgi:UDP-glucose 4-epimerase
MKVIIIDDFSNCQKDILPRIFSILSPEKSTYIHVREGNILDAGFLEKVFLEQR